MKMLQCALFCLVLVALSLLVAGGPAAAAYSLKGQVLGAGAPIAKSTVTLWEAGANEPSNWHRHKPVTTVALP